ncbi:MAG TPA: FAD-dependent oxidoreductase, partial [Burkholderiaceae bacterium]|nr:FAD-dependent oxidoreductase [Burkholderiaceae bacterium]
RPKPPFTLPRPILALTVDEARHHHGHFVFNRSVCGGPNGWVAVVISAATEAMNLPREVLVRGCANQLGEILGNRCEVEDSRVIIEKRATFACVPGLKRPKAITPMPNLLLAGDYTEGEYPAVLEQAVLSGERAARLID